MKVLVVGSDGMLGHQLLKSFRGCYELAGTVRRSIAREDGKIDAAPKVFGGVDVADFEAVKCVLDKFRPDAVVNAVGIVKQRREAHDSIQSIEVNALFPHRLAQACVLRGIRMVHMSTDCVFSGRAGGYTDEAFADADDLYGRTKCLGEVFAPDVVTLRTSIIGLELFHKKSLVEWFLAQHGIVRGYKKAIYSGFTTLQMAHIIKCVLMRSDVISGVYNVSSEPIDKYALLCGINDRIKHDVTVIEDIDFECDRSLDSRKFRSEFGYAPPTWNSMLDGLAEQILERESYR